MKVQRVLTIVAAFTVFACIVDACNSPSQSGLTAQQATSNQVGSAISTPDPNSVNWPVLNPATTPAPSIVAVIEDTIKRADKVQNDADWDGYDLSLFPTVFIDDPRVPLSASQLQFLQEVREAQGNAVAAELLGNGWLTCMKAFELNFKRADDNWARIFAKAKAEHRDPTPQERDSANEGVVGGVGSPPDPQATRPAYVAPPFDFKSIITEEGMTDVIYDDGIALTRVFLVETSEGWRIAGRVRLKVHY